MHITLINPHEWIETTRKINVIGIELEVRGVKIKITFSQDEQSTFLNSIQNYFRAKDDTKAT